MKLYGKCHVALSPPLNHLDKKTPKKDDFSVRDDPEYSSPSVAAGCFVLTAIKLCRIFYTL